MDYGTIAALVGISIAAGFFDAIAGGGGLITLPSLLVFGMDPISAIATNKFQAASATISASATFVRKKMVNWNIALPIGAMALTGGVTGALLVNSIPKEWASTAIPFLLIGVALYFLFSPGAKVQRAVPLISTGIFAVTVAPALGIYDGVFGPGIGSFLMISFVGLCGFPILKAMAHTKFVNACSNIGCLLIFVFSGDIVWSVAIPMAGGAFIGAQLGATTALRVGSRVIRPIIVCVCCLLAIKLLSDPKNLLNKYFRQSFMTHEKGVSIKVSYSDWKYN